MNAAITNRMPQTAREFFDYTRQSALRVIYLEDLVTSESRRVEAIRATRGAFNVLEDAVPYVLRHMESRLDTYLAEYTEASLICDVAEKIVARVPDALGSRVLRARYLQGWDVERVTREFGIARGTVYNAERRAMEWVDANGLLSGTAARRTATPAPAVA